MQYVKGNSKRVVIARFDEGEDLLMTLKKCAEENNIRCGWFSVIGGLKKLAYGLYENGEYRNITKEAENCFELLPTFGNITLKNGETLIHAHINASDEDNGTCCGGHLIEGSIIFPFAEVVIQECDGSINRKFDPKTKLWPMNFQKG